MNDLYRGCPHCGGVKNAADGTELPFRLWDENIIDQALTYIYYKLVDVETDIEGNLFSATLATINEAIDEAIGEVQFGEPNYDFLNALKTNNRVWAAFKTHRQQNDLAQLLLDLDGNLVSFDKFKRLSKPITGVYNQNWLAAEYNTAVIRARQAARMKQFERDADLYPNLTWTESTSIERRLEHVALYGLTLPVNHPFWLKHYPGDIWNCKCGITNTDEPVSENLPDVDYTPSPGLDGNPMTTKKIFSDTNPYKANAYPGARKAVMKAVK